MICSDRFPPFDRGGAERIAFYHAQGLVARGFDVAVYTSHEPTKGAQPETRDEDGVRVYRAFPVNTFTEQEEPTFFDKVVRFPLTVQNPWMESGLNEAVEDFDPDLIHAHDGAI